MAFSSKHGRKEEPLMPKSTVTRRTLLKTVALASFAAPAIMRNAYAQEPVEITWWGWSLSGAQDEFRRRFPHVKLTYVNTGGYSKHYEKIRNALKAKTGLPDIVDIEYEHVPSFAIINALADLNQLGADKLKNDYLDWSWAQCNIGGKQVAFPWGCGPMISYYRKDVLDHYGLSLPETWAESAENARKMAKRTTDQFWTNFFVNQPSCLNGLFWQNGARPFKLDGSRISISINSERAKSVLAYWQGLLDDKAIDSQPTYTNEWFSAIDAGRYGLLPGVPWQLRRMLANGKAGAGHWRGAPIQQWKSGQHVSANWGGMTLAILNASPKKRQAFEVVKWLLNNDDASRLHLDAGLFPVLKRTLQNDALMSEKLDFMGGQEARKIFRRAAEEVDTNFQFSPFEGYVQTVMKDEISAAAAGKGGTLVDALDRVQAKIVDYAKGQGFTVV
jgi:multiple sugar transport system substrate-binding protein